MVHVRGQSVQRQDVPHLMEEHGAAGMVRLPAPWHTEQLLGQPGQAQALPHGSVSQHGGGSALAASQHDAHADQRSRLIVFMFIERTRERRRVLKCC